MKRRGWTLTAIGTVLVAVATGASIVFGAVDQIAASPLFSIATLSYVDAKIDAAMVPIADEQAVQGRKLDALGNMQAEQMISNLEDKVALAQAALVAVTLDLRANPDVLSLQIAKLGAERKLEEAEDQLRRAKCYRFGIISGQETFDCRAATE